MSIESLKPLIHWLQMHPELAIFFSFIIAFLESIAFIGLIVPGSVILAAIGVLVGAQIIPPFETMLFAVLGAFLGDLLSFLFGYYYRLEIREKSIFQKYSSWVVRAENFFDYHGGKGIFLGRFIGPLRPIMPIIVGMIGRVSWLKFCCVDFFSALLWAPGYMLPGIMIGAASQAFDPDLSSRIILLFLALLFFIWCFFLLLRKIIRFFLGRMVFLFQKTWDYLRISRFKGLVIGLEIKDEPNNCSPFILLFIAFSLLFFFFLLTQQVFYSGEQFSLNLDFWHFFRSFYSDSLQKIAINLSLFFSPLNFFLLWFFISIWCFFNKNYKILIYWLTLGSLAIGLDGFFKNALMLPTPEGLSQLSVSYSYPNLHIVLAASLLPFFSILIIDNYERVFQLPFFILVYFLIFLIALSQLILGVHWIADILGSFLLGSFLFLIIFLGFQRKKYAPLPVQKILIFTFSIFVFGFGAQYYLMYEKHRVSYQPVWGEITFDDKKWWSKGFVEELFYRKNRLGHPMQTMNLQWKGDIETIEKNLKEQGWQRKPKSAIIHAIHYLGSKDHSHIAPLTTGVFNDHIPVLQMTKYFSEKDKLLILRLWESPIFLEKSNQLLYAGTISFAVDPKKHFEVHFVTDIRNRFDASDNPQALFIKNLKGFTWKVISLPDVKPLNHQEDESWLNYLLLIKDKP